MKKHLPLLAILTLLTTCALAQSSLPPLMGWDENPHLRLPDSKYALEPAVILFSRVELAYTDDPKEGVLEYYSAHKLVQINDDRGIEDFNKIYLGVSDNSDIVQIRARTILPNGKIIEVSKANIKDIKEEDGTTYKIFAMEGLEKGCEVEYLYTFKRPTSFTGREVVQESVPVLETHFTIEAPKRLKFELKCYNFSAAGKDTVLGERRLLQADLGPLQGLEEEKYAFYRARLGRIEFKLCYNDEVQPGVRLYTWNELAKKVYSIYTDYTDKEYAGVAALVNTGGWAQLPDEAAKIAAAENFIKKNFSFNEDEEHNELGSVLKNRVAGKVGLMRLYGAVFRDLGVGFQFVLAGDRSSYLLDRSFENWDNAENCLLFFPAENKFIAPDQPDYRFPFIAPLSGATDGLYCRTTTLGNFTTAIGVVKDIPLENYDRSYENVECSLSLTTGMDSLTFDDRLVFGGYPAADYRETFIYANSEQKEKILKESAKINSGSDNLIFSEIINPEQEKTDTAHPFIIHLKTCSGEMIENAGNKLLIKIGMAIGPQEEMYQQKPRQLPVDIEYPHVEERHIRFLIPEGYIITNASDLNLNQTYTDSSGELTMGFVSGFEIRGNVLLVHIMEQYRKTFYPMDELEAFRKVINASSDFNKVVLVLAKK